MTCNSVSIGGGAELSLLSKGRSLWERRHGGLTTVLDLIEVSCFLGDENVSHVEFDSETECPFASKL